MYRLPGVFGKWARPNYNSVVATFCHNTVHGLALVRSRCRPGACLHRRRRDATSSDGWMATGRPMDGRRFSPVYRTTVGEVARLVTAFRAMRDTLTTERVGTGFVRALYSTYISYLPPEQFSYQVPKYGDQRGHVRRGAEDPGLRTVLLLHRASRSHAREPLPPHKTEKFVVLRGRGALSLSPHRRRPELRTASLTAQSRRWSKRCPGWAHDITNIGDSDMVVMLWANEVFDRQRPDTYACAL